MCSKFVRRQVAKYIRSDYSFVTVIYQFSVYSTIRAIRVFQVVPLEYPVLFDKNSLRVFIDSALCFSISNKRHLRFSKKGALVFARARATFRAYRVADSKCEKTYIYSYTPVTVERHRIFSSWPLTRNAASGMIRYYLPSLKPMDIRADGRSTRRKYCWKRYGKVLLFCTMFPLQGLLYWNVGVN